LVRVLDGAPGGPRDTGLVAVLLLRRVVGLGEGVLGLLVASLQRRGQLAVLRVPVAVCLRHGISFQIDIGSGAVPTINSRGRIGNRCRGSERSSENAIDSCGNYPRGVPYAAWPSMDTPRT